MKNTRNVGRFFRKKEGLPWKLMNIRKAAIMLLEKEIMNRLRIMS